jgi:hypothetical protein
MKLVNLIPLKEIDFRNQDQFDDYNKQHKLRPATKVTIAGKVTTAGQAAKESEPTKGSSVFGKDSGGSVFGKSDSMATVNSIAAKTGLRAQAVAGWADENGVNLSKVAADIDSKKLKPMDMMTAVSGNPGNKYAKDIISKYSQSASKDEPTSKPKEARKGNPSVNKEAKKNAETFGITPQKLGNDGYKKAMYQAAVEALTDSNFHDEARELISKIEGKPEWAKRVDYPKMDDPKYKEKMADLRKNGVDSSEYWGGEDGTHEFARKVSSASGWDGADAADGIAFTLRMNGFHKQADMIQSVFDDKPYMKENNMKLVNLVPLKEIDFTNQDQFDDYNKQHKLRPDTKVTVAGKVTTAGQAAQKSEPVKGSSVFGKDSGGSVFDKSGGDTTDGGSNDKANNVIKGLKPAKYGGKHPDSMEMGGSLYRINKKGEAVRDKEVRLKDITPEDITSTEKLFGVDLSKGIENGLDYETNDLIVQTKRLQQFDKGGEFEDKKFYDSLLSNIKSGIAKGYMKKIAAAEKGKASAVKYPTKSDDPSYWKDDKKSDSRGYSKSRDDDYDGGWGEGPQLTSDRLGKVESALEDDLKLSSNGFTTTRESSSGMGGWEGPMTIIDKNAEQNNGNYVSLSVGSPNNDGKFSIAFANDEGMPYFETNNDALSGDRDLTPQQAFKVTKALMQMPEVGKLLKGQMSIDEFQPIYDKLKSKFSKGSSIKENHIKLKSLIKRK